MKKKKIAIIDDDREFAYEIKDILDGNGYCAECISDIDDGIFRKAVKMNPDVILLDLKLKNISGIRIYNELKGSKATADIPIIVVSGVYKDAYHEDLMKEYGVQDFLVKPFDPAELLLKIGVLFEKQLINKEMEKVNKIEKELDHDYKED
jgi:DNA-binding response OmpR family regulator